jgi:hypothetical protein
MLRRLIDFIKSRPTEVWLGLWTAIVAVLYGAEAPTWVTGVSAVIAWIVTFIASKTESLGPQPTLPEPMPEEPTQ